jgi:hypothetical protein
VAQRLIRRIGKTDQAFRLGDGPAVHTSLNSSGRSLRQSDSANKRSPSAWLRRSLTCSRCDVSSADLIIRNSFGGGGFSGSLPAGWPQLVHNPLPGDLGGRDERHDGLVVIRAVAGARRPCRR